MPNQEVNQFRVDSRVDNLAGTDCEFARIKDDTIFIEEWMRNRSGASELIAKYPNFKVRYIKSLHYLDMPVR